MKQTMTPILLIGTKIDIRPVAYPGKNLEDETAYIFRENIVIKAPEISMEIFF
jgi:hypothetical protein